ncbi:hypothetical protein V6N12_056997 [Hibiscus sabdariffa]|uniref:RING-type domain-containing protein n=1 Tax=Hibiscus sabdariffa TaxID=183260 RepID=A0ABR2DCQ0_9ROSI
MLLLLPYLKKKTLYQMEQTPENLHERNDHVLDIPNDGHRGNNGESRNSQEPMIQPTSYRGSSHGSLMSSFCFWVYVRLVFNISQIVASVAVLVVSRNERPQAPLSTWIVGYAAGCAACIPILFHHCFLPYPMLCIMFLVFSYIEFTMPFILCVVLACCCGDLGLIRGAPSECIDSLPTYTFKLQKDCNGSIKKINSEVKEGAEATGAEKDCAISGDDAVCCICLTSYADNDVLKELPCSHVFHKSCVDKWLKMKAFCPLCKCTILSKK